MPDPDLSGSVLDGRYQVIAPIAEGAMGSVYRGERLKLGRAVAIKVMHQSLPDELSSRERFEREAKLMALLEHPHCVSVIDYGLHDDKPFLVMELVRGTSLLEVLASGGPLTPAHAVAVLKQVLSGLAHAHELGIVHRDIKPANIMVTEQTGLGERIRILDFGLAKLTEQTTKLTTGIVVGTPNYMAPEQIKGGELDARTDLYACGVMLFELLTGGRPFVAEDPIAVVRKHLNDRPPRMADVRPGSDFGALEAVVAKALAKAPADRYANAVEMSAALDAALAATTAAATAAAAGSAPAGFAHAVPQTAPPVGNQIATETGWAVPSSFAPPPQSTPIDPSLSIPVEPSSPIPVAPSNPFPPSSPFANPNPGPSPNPNPNPNPGPNPNPNPNPNPSPSPIPNPNPNPIPISSPIPNPISSPSLSPISTPNPNAIAALPFTRRQLALGGGGVLALVILIAVIAGGSHGTSKSAPPPKEPPPVAAANTGSADPLAPLVARGNDLYNSGDVEGGIELMREARRKYPQSAELAYVAGKLYFAKLWWAEGIKNFRDALHLDPTYSGDPELLKIAVRAFNTTPDVDDRLASFLHDDIGPSVVPLLEDGSKNNSNAAIRARDAAELRRYH